MKTRKKTNTYRQTDKKVKGEEVLWSASENCGRFVRSSSMGLILTSGIGIVMGKTPYIRYFLTVKQQQNEYGFHTTKKNNNNKQITKQTKSIHVGQQLTYLNRKKG